MDYLKFKVSGFEVSSIIPYKLLFLNHGAEEEVCRDAQESFLCIFAQMWLAQNTQTIWV